MFDKPEVFKSWLHFASMGIEGTGVFIIVFGAFFATLLFVRAYMRDRSSLRAYPAYRANLGRGILLGLEFLVAADIVGTVAVAPTWNNVGVLGVIIVIRTFLSFTLEAEIHGTLPWKKNKDS